jgi:hypothetical protein
MENFKTHKMILSVLLPSLQLAKVMAIPKFEIGFLQNVCSNNFWVSHFLTITKRHILLEHINTLNSSLLVLSSNTSFSKFDILTFF